MKCQSFSSKNNLNDTAQISEDMREIYIEKFTKIGRHTIVKSAQSCG